MTWGPCPDDYFVKEPDDSFKRAEVDCATLAVPAVYGKASDLPDFGIAMMRLRAKGGTKNLGTLFVNPGGPGGSGVEEIQHQPFPSAIRKSYDIVGFDPRGVLHSQPVSGNPIRCSDEMDFGSYWNGELSPDTKAQVNDLLKEDAAFNKDCQSRNPGWWTLGTDNVVRDLDLMRGRITGKAPLNFLGSSYGTTIAADYLRMFPKHNGHIVLDSPTSNEMDSDAAQIEQARSMEAQVLRLVDGYAKARHRSRAKVEADMVRFREWGDNDELKGYVGLKPFPDDPGARISSEFAFMHGIMALTYFGSDQAQKPFNAGMDALLKDQWNGLFEYFAFNLDGYDTDAMYDAYQAGKPYDPHGFTRDNSFEILQMVNGIDRDQRDRTSKAQQDAFERKFKAAAPFLWSLGHDPKELTVHYPHPGNPWSWVAYDDPNIPNPPKGAPKRVNTSGKAVMIIGSRNESTTPYPFALKTAKDLKSPLITWNGTEHAPLAGFQHTCLNDLLIAYLVHDKLPKTPVTCRS